jgi:hypothetical protein
LALIIVLVIRLTVPLTIVRWPFAGGLLAIAADTVDILFFQWLGFPGFAGYHEVDKILDVYYLGIEALVAQRWTSPARHIATLLFVYRLIGVALFEITEARWLLLVFPNVFELFFLAYAYVQAYRPSYAVTARTATIWLVLLMVPKLGQEYLLHSARVLDDHVALDIIGDVLAAVADWLPLSSRLRL